VSTARQQKTNRVEVSITHELAVLMKPTAVGAGRIPPAWPPYTAILTRSQQNCR